MLDPNPEIAPPPLGVRIAHGSLVYDGKPVFAGLDADFPGGSFTCILGASGVGKSSLLRMIAGLGPDFGDAALGSDGGTLTGRIAFMDQRDLLLPWLSALDNVLLGARLRGNSRDSDRARALLADVGLSDSAALLPAQLSGGMRQRVALARTLMEDQPVVLMDEPFSAVDALTRMKLQDLSARLLSNRTVILVTHDPMEAARLGDAIHVLSGSPAAFGSGVFPPGPTPRDPSDPMVTKLQTALLAKLGVGMA
jgi:putative hydroxymethylpyrimidine transport system ATP-binding protein